MVLPASDSLHTGFGFDADAPALMPESDGGVMPDGGDYSALPDDGYDDGAATASEEQPFSIDVLTPEQRAVLDQHYEQTIGQREMQKFETDKRNLQRTLEGQKANLQQDIATLEAWFQSYLQKAANGEITPDPRDYAVMQQQLRQAREQSEQQNRAQYQSFESWAQGSIQRMQAFVVQQATGDNGEQLFNPNDPQLTALAKDMYVKAAPALRQGATDAQVEAYRQAWQAHQAATFKMREQALVQRLSGKRVNDARSQQATRSRQQQRGRQDTSRGGAAGGTPDIASMIAAVQQEFKADPSRAKAPYAEIHKEAYRRMASTG